MANILGTSVSRFYGLGVYYTYVLRQSKQLIPVSEMLYVAIPLVLVGYTSKLIFVQN